MSSLAKYRTKRDFARTAEPRGRSGPSVRGKSYVIQKHAARRLHYDLRLELDGALLSRAVPKGPSLDPDPAVGLEAVIGCAHELRAIFEAAATLSSAWRAVRQRLRPSAA